jgi:regulator of protease activity HflC (stomatin/prohibitin superfamily)
VAVLLLSSFIWFFCRIEVGVGEIALLIRKTGTPLAQGQVIALKPGEQGIQLEVLAEGRYFYNPYTWEWVFANITDIPAGQLGVLTRLYGEDLPPGQILAAEGQKGIVAEARLPGKYRINPYAYRVEIFPAFSVPPGSVGVMTMLTGSDVLSDDLPEAQRNTFLVGDTQKGVRPQVIDPGTYYLNPYVTNVTVVTLQSQRFEMSGEDVIGFLTLDGFEIQVEGTVEFAIARDQAALLTHRVGDMEDVLRKVILPRARGFSRIEGSKHSAVDFIVGETRQRFQDNLEAHLKKEAKDWGVTIKSVLIRNIRPPDQVASVIREREVAVQTARKFEQQIEQARSKAELTKQEMLAIQSQEKVAAETTRIRAVIEAEQSQAVRLMAARKELEVVEIDVQAAQAQSLAILARAEGDRAVVQAHSEAQAAVRTLEVQAFGGGMNLARWVLYGKLAPRIETILSDEREGLGLFLRSYLQPEEVQP